MDSSDGLSTTLNEMSRQSKNKFIINNIPTMKDVVDYAKSQKTDLNNLVFHGGEEYEFVFTTHPKNRSRIKKNAKMSKTPIIEIGHVTKGKGVFVESEKRFDAFERSRMGSFQITSFSVQDISFDIICNADDRLCRQDGDAFFPIHRLSRYSMRLKSS